MKTQCKFIGAVLITLFMFPVSIFAETTDQKVKALETRVRQLEKTVHQLESMLNQKQESEISGSPSASGISKGKGKWRSLQKGMTKQQVRQILGEPPKIDTGFSIDIWYYPDIMGGTVTFSNDSNTLSAWSEPSK